MSWQQRRKTKERELLDHAHGPGHWIPGLVRPYPIDTDGESLVVPTPSDIVRQRPTAGNTSERSAAQRSAVDCAEGPLNTRPSDHSMAEQQCSTPLGGLSDQNLRFIERVQEFLYIGSIGEPLSQAESPRELLYAVYDLLETHANLLEEEIIHRDVSWFNVMLKPAHHIDKQANTQERPCIRKILHECGRHSDSKQLVSSVLLADLDHAADVKELERQSHLRERTGTAMFIAAELSDPTEFFYLSDPGAWNTIFKALRWVDDQGSLGAAALLSAFPHGDGDFMAALREVSMRDQAREGDALQLERPVHSARHDGESIYWVFLWAFARARPRGTPLEGTTSRPSTRFSTFCKIMLAHEVGDPGSGLEHDRAPYMKDSSSLMALFHPDLAKFEELFIAMAAYLKIPWHLYPELPVNHVHIAYRRMVIGFVLKTKAAVLDIALDTEQPRIMHDPVKEGKGPERDPSACTDSLASVGASGRADVLDELLPSLEPEDAPETGDSQSSRKRKATGSSNDGGPPKKLAGPGRKPQLPGMPADGPANDGDDDDDPARSAKKYSHDLHLHLRTAHALSLKVWKDRTLWFSKGN
ncbi:hypothetical protein AURDEDRAFT_110235 [Auricularia subglabra TFB-10046 SS5]|nr:hypothetical protein AURDEDRAFT_110235 [Auricularia subglabra TFB-10046 SS5]